MDGMRPHTARLWSMLCDECRREFLRTDALLWDTHRHRMPRRHRRVDRADAGQGALTVAAAHVVEVEDVGGALLVAALGRHVSPGRPCGQLHGTPGGRLAQPRPAAHLVLAAGHASAGPLGMGLATDAEGRVRAADGAVGAVWTLGALRRGELWESTAVPEIRSQAVAVAQAITTQVVASTHRTPLRRRVGEPGSTRSSARTDDAKSADRSAELWSSTDSAREPSHPNPPGAGAAAGTAPFPDAVRPHPPGAGAAEGAVN